MSQEPTSTDPANADPTMSLAARIERLEESHAFAQHDVDQLTGQIVELDHRLRELTARVARLEAGAAEIDERGPETEPAPPQ